MSRDIPFVHPSYAKYIDMLRHVGPVNMQPLLQLTTAKRELHRASPITGGSYQGIAIDVIAFGKAPPCKPQWAVLYPAADILENSHASGTWGRAEEGLGVQHTETYRRCLLISQPGTHPSDHARWN